MPDVCIFFSKTEKIKKTVDIYRSANQSTKKLNIRFLTAPELHFLPFFKA